jgi:hypothetical protein
LTGRIKVGRICRAVDRLGHSLGPLLVDEMCFNWGSGKTETTQIRGGWGHGFKECC